MGEYRYIFAFVIAGPPIIMFAVALGLSLLSWRLAAVWLAFCGALVIAAAFQWWPFSSFTSPDDGISTGYAILLGIGWLVAFGWFVRWMRRH